MGLLDDAISPPAAAYGAEPFTVAELDAHPDRDRIWATLRALRAEHEAAVEQAGEDGYRQGVEAYRDDDA